MYLEECTCWRCGKPLIGQEGCVMTYPLHSPTGYPEDTSMEEREYCMECYNIITEGLDQEVEL